MADENPVGQRYSHVYLRRGEPVADSDRVRVRLSESCPTLTGLSDYLTRELGVRVSHRYIGDHGASGVHNSFFKSGEMRDLLDAITLIYNYVKLKGYNSPAEHWLKEVRRIFKEENLGYRVDEAGGVHFFLDQVFELHRTAALSSLNSPRYANALNEFDRAYRALDHVPPDNKGAIRSIFTAVEGLFRLMFLSAPRLGAKEASQHLPPLIDRLYGHDQTAKFAAGKLVSAFKEWVDAAHFYRHEQGREEPVQPPDSVAFLLIDQGATFVRWLAELDALNSKGLE
ncbi:MAG: hypothetical protein O9352_21380 [Rhizobium sp.]|nr:hypothetical protein [Rhizobium sp.]